MDGQQLTGTKLKLQFDFPLAVTAAKNGNHPFTATITHAGKPSDAPVGGTENIPGGPYRVLIPKDLMEAKIAELIGKSAFAAATFDTHEGATNVGSFVDSWTEPVAGEDGVVAARASGLLVAKGENKSLVEALVQNARAGLLGFSYDLKDVYGYLDGELIAGEVIEVLTDFKWRGATILFRDAAAYKTTHLAARKQLDPNHSTSSISGSIPQINNSTSTKEKIEMDETKLKELIQSAMTAAMAPLNQLQPSITSIQETIKGITDRVVGLEAKATPATAQADDKLDKAAIQAMIADALKPAPTAGAEFKLEEFTAAVTQAVTNGLKPVLDQLASPGKPADGKRQTLSAEQLQTVKRWNDFDGDEPTVEHIQAAITQVHDTKGLTSSQKEAALTALSLMKRQMLKAEMQGGAQ